MADAARATVHPLPPPKRGRDKTAAERQRRYRERNKEPLTAAPPPVTAAVTVAHRTVTRNVTAGVDAAAYIAAIALAGVAALFSIRGMAVLFPGATTQVIAMAGAMEAAKLVAAGWLAARWSVTPWVARLTLVTLIAGLAVINATGVYAQLVAAHVGKRGEAASAVQMLDTNLAARIDVQAHVVADLDRRLGQIDSAIEEAAKRGKTATALPAMEGQRRSRAALADERNRQAGTLAALKTERASVAAKGRQADTESAPIRYVAELVGSGYRYEDNPHPGRAGRSRDGGAGADRRCHPPRYSRVAIRVPGDNTMTGPTAITFQVGQRVVCVDASSNR